MKSRQVKKLITVVDLALKKQADWDVIYVRNNVT